MTGDADHVVEHNWRGSCGNRLDHGGGRIRAWIEAIRATHQRVRLVRACLSAPDIGGIFALKAGSSLYAGKAATRRGFHRCFSDLTSVLSKTRFLIPCPKGKGSISRRTIISSSP